MQYELRNLYFELKKCFVLSFPFNFYSLQGVILIIMRLTNTRVNNITEINKILMGYFH